MRAQRDNDFVGSAELISKLKNRLLPAALLLPLIVGCADQRPMSVNLPPPPLGRSKQVTYFAPARTGEARPSLAPASAQAVPVWQPQVAERKWRYIIVHHSATDKGSAAFFDRVHRDQGWEGLGYHFVIGNGTMNVADGQIEPGPRWREQRGGAHCKVRGRPEFNEYGIGICLVGNFNNGLPSEAQMRSLAALIRRLQARYDIPKSRIQGHGSLKATDCPGKKFNMDDLYRRL